MPPSLADSEMPVEIAGAPERAPPENAATAAFDRQKTAAGPLSANKKEIGGVAGPEPTRFGDWEKKGRCIDF